MGDLAQEGLVNHCSRLRGPSLSGTGIRVASCVRQGVAIAVSRLQVCLLFSNLPCPRVRASQCRSVRQVCCRPEALLATDTAIAETKLEIAAVCDKISQAVEKSFLGRLEEFFQTAVDSLTAKNAQPTEAAKDSILGWIPKADQVGLGIFEYSTCAEYQHIAKAVATCVVDIQERGGRGAFVQVTRICAGPVGHGPWVLSAPGSAR